MSEETKEVQEQPAKAPEEIQLEDVLEDAPVVSQKKETSEKPEEPETEEKPEEPDVDEKSTEVTTEPEEKTEPEKIKIGEKDYSLDELSVAVKDSENKSNWQKSLTKKSQIINKYDDDTLARIETTAQILDKMKDFKTEPLPETLAVKDEFGDEIKINSSVLKPHIDKLIEAAKNKWVEEFAPKLSEAEKIKQESESKVNQASNQAALVRMEQYFTDFPDSSIDLGDDPVETLNDIKEAGATHPDYRKLLNLEAVAHRAKMLGISMKEAHTDLFGKSDQIKKADKTIKEEQEKGALEKPGKKGMVVSEDEKFEKTLGIGVKKTENVFD